MKTAAKYLAEKGIEVIQTSEQCLMCGFAQDVAVELTKKDENYCVESTSEKMPGPGEDDFAVTYSTLDEALLAVWCFYFAKPVEINAWVIPMHRRPFWALSKLQYRLANLAHISEAQFEAIKETRHRRSLQSLPRGKPIGGLELAARSQFLGCSHVSDANLRLTIRRDLEEAYVVSKLSLNGF